jgi:uncharacterized protein
MIYFQKLAKIPNYISIFLVYCYRTIFSPSVGILRFLPFYPKNTCIFYPTCSEYALLAFKKYSFYTALKKTIDRIRRCHPWNESKIDYP